MRRVLFTTAVIGLLATSFTACKSEKSSGDKKPAEAGAASTGTPPDVAGGAGAPASLTDKKDRLSYMLGVQIGKTLHNQKVKLSNDGFLAGFKDGLAEKVDDSRASYGIGAEIGGNFHKSKISVNDQSFLAGVNDSMAEATLKLSEPEMRQIFMDFQKEKQEEAIKERQAEAAKNLEAGTKFLEENAKKPGIVTLPSGLQYRVIKEGAGESPKLADKVKANYVGKLSDGKEFDSSAKHGNGPVEFPVTGVIPAWTEALQLMKPGAKWEIFVPAKLGYGEQGNGPTIPPNAVLAFEMELVSVEKGAPAKPAAKPAKPAAKPGK